MHKLFSIGSLLLVMGMLLTASPSPAQVAVGIAVSFGPPELPVYEQPLCPSEGYIWVPGYWAWDADFDDYYWIPGTWVEPPEVGFLWTPGYWGWGGSAFFFHEGYWGPVVGFYGGINYGFGYFGRGYEGGRWDGGRFYYNRSVNNINVTEIHNVYNTTVINNNYSQSRVSYNGGNGGINERATAQEEAAARQRHVGPIAAQSRQIQEARGNPELRASQNHGRPAIAATARPGAFDRGVVAARSGGNYNPPPRGGHNESRPPEARGGSNASRPPENRNESNASRPPNARHVNELPPVSRPSPRDSGNAAADRKYQQQQDKLFAKQDQERAKLQQKQEQDHQRMAQQRADESRRQQMEQRHQQETQQLVEKHQQQQQHFEQHQQQSQPRQSQPNQKEHR